MPTSRIEIIVDGRDNASGALRSIGDSMDQLGGHAGKVGGALGRMGEIAGGIIGAQAIMGVGRALGGAVKEAFEATASYEKLGMALENLAKKDFMRAGTATKLIQVGTQEVGQTAKNAQAITDLTLKRDLLMAKMQEQTERHRQLIAKWGEEGLAVKTHAAQMAIDREAIDKVNAKLGELGAAGSKTVAVYKKVTEQFISDAEAKEMAAKTSKELLGWIEQLAIKSPFTQDGIQSAFKTAMAYGFITDQAADLMVKTGQLDEKQRANTVTAQRLTQAMIDYAAGAGLSPEVMDRVSLALGQIQARGKLAGQEVMQLTEAGISVDAILAQAFGKSTSEIVAMREKGLIPADKAILAITQSLEKDFGGAAAAQTQTFAGLVSSLSDIKTIGLREFFTGTFEALQPYLAGFTNWASTLGPKLSEIGATLGTAVAGALQTISGLLQSFQTGGVGGLLGALGLPPEAAALIQTVATNVQILAGAAGALFTALTGGVPQLGGLQAGLASIDAGLPGLMGNMVFLGSTVDGVVKQVVGSFTTDWGPAWNTAKLTVEQAIDGARSIVINVLTLITGSIADHATQLKALFFEAYGRVQQIVGQVLTAVNLIVTGILGNIKTFIATHGDDIRTFLGNAWEQIARIINLATQVIQATIVPIFQGIARFIQEHGDEIQKGLEVTWNAIKGIIQFVLDLIEGILRVALKVLKGDWSGAWEEIKKTGEKLLGDIKQVVNANLEALKLLFGKAIDNIKQKVSTWLDDTKKKIEDGLQKASDSVQAKLDEIKQWFVDKFNEIFDWLTAQPERMLQIGRDLVQGLIDGLREKAQDAIDFIKALCDDVIAWAKRILHMSSPSLVFVQIGIDILRGLIAGLQAATPAAVQAMVEALSAVLDAVSKALDTFARLADMPVIEDLAGRIATLLSYIRALVAAFAALKTQLSDPALRNARLVLEPLSDIFAKLQTVIQGIAALGGLEVPTDLVDRVATFVTTLQSIMPALIATLVQIAGQFTPAAQLAAAAFAETAGLVVAPLSAMADTFTRLASYVPADVSAAIHALVSATLAAALEMYAAANRFEAPILEGATRFAAAAGQVVAPLTAMADAFTRLASFVPMNVSDAIQALVASTLGAAQDMYLAATRFEAPILEGAVKFAEAAGKIVAPLTAMVDAFIRVASWVPQNLEPVFAGLLSQLRRLARLWIVAARGWDEELLAGALMFAETAAKLTAPITGTVEALKAAATWIPRNLEPVFAGLLSQLRRLARLWIVAASGWDEELLTGALMFAETAAKLTAPITGTVEALKAAATWIPRNLEPVFAGLLSQLRRLARLWIVAATGFDNDLLEAATAFADAASKIVAPLKAMVDAFTAVAGYSLAFVEITIPFATLVGHLQQLVPLMIAAAETFDAKSVQAAAAFGENVGKIVAPLKAMVDAFTAVAGYNGRLDIVLPFGALVGALALLLQAIIDVLPRFDAKMVEAAAVFGQRIQQIVGFVQPGIAAIKALAEYTAAENLAAAVAAFIADILIVAIALKDGLGSLTEQLRTAYDGAIVFAERIQKVVGVVQPGITAIKALAGYTAAHNIGGAVRAFIADVLIVARGLKDGLGSLSEAVLAAYDAAIQFAQRIQGVVGVVQPGLAAIAALAQYQAANNIAAKVQAFIADIIIVATELKNGLSNATPEMLAALDAARQFTDRVQGIFNFIQPAIATMRELRDYARPYGVGTGIVTLLRDLETLITWLNTFAGSIGANTITAALAFAETLERIVASIEAAMAGLARLVSAYSAGELVGGSWMDGIIAGLNSRLTDLETLMAYIRGLFPSSPAKYGPFRSLPDGKAFGATWGGGMVAGLGATIRPLTSMLDGLQSSMSLQPATFGGGSSYAYSHTVNLNGTFNVREDQDIERIAGAVDALLSQKAAVNRRMNLAWSAM